MNKKIKTALKGLLPLYLVDKYMYSRSYKFGNYRNWQHAKSLSDGYESDIVLNKVKESMLKVTKGQFAFARDSVLFDDIQYSFPVLAGILRAALENGSELCILDFGGALGSSYYQCRNFLGALKKLSWNIVEQPNFVSCGRQYFQSENLKFFYTIEECLKEESPQLALFSGVIQSIEEPFRLLDEIISYGFKYLIFDRTSFVKKGPDKLAIQKVPSAIYKCSYPIWFFNYENFLEKFSKKYKLLVTFDTCDKARLDLFFKGFILERK